MLTVTTRAIDLNVPERKSPAKVLVPVLDMVNMAIGYPQLRSTIIQHEVSEKDPSQYLFYVTDTFKAGDQVGKFNYLILTEN